MRLLNVHTRLLEEFFDVDITPKYAILSHTWGKEEVTFQDLQSEDYESKTGYRKIEGCCVRAVQDGYDYVWIDTCCIDKKDSSELSEAINSMYQWYSASAVCYVYLADVEADEGWQLDSTSLKNSRWFSRGWTLQELLAPLNVVFFDHSWRTIGFTSKDMTSYPMLDITSMLSATTRIDERVLRNTRNLRKITAAERFSWAAHRQTTRKEDMAYCLLGILGVSMPLLYGEGERAFIRLQQEYIQQYNDPTLLLWGFGIPCQDILWRSTSDWALAPSVSLFSGFSSCPIDERNDVPFKFSYTNNGVEIELLLLDLNDNMKVACFGGNADFLIRNRKSLEKSLPSPLLWPLQRVRKRRITSTFRTIIALPLVYCPVNSMRDFEVYERALSFPPFPIPRDFCWKAKWTRVYLKGVSVRPNYSAISVTPDREYNVGIESLIKEGFNLEAVYPPACVVFTRVRVIIPIKSQGCHRYLLIFRGPNDLSIGLFLEYQFDKSQLLHIHKALGEITTADLLHHLLPRGEKLSERARRKAWVEVRRTLQGTRGIEASSLKISGKRLGKPEIDHAVVSAHDKEWPNSKFVSTKLLWRESQANQSDDEKSLSS